MFNSYSPVQNIIFVSEDEARNYIIPPSSKVLLMSKDAQRFWIKTSDSWGQTTLIPYEFKEIAPPSPTIQDSSQFVTKDDLKSFKDEIRELLSSRPTQSQPLKEEQQNAKSVNEW